MSSQLLPFRDPNGFRKLIVLLTEPGAAPALIPSQGQPQSTQVQLLLALHQLSGRV